MTTLNDKDAEAYRIKQVKKIFAPFECATGHPARTVEELEEWVGSAEGKAAMAYYRTADGKIIPW